MTTTNTAAHTITVGGQPIPTRKPDMLLWLDVETTGIKPTADLLEIGLRCTSMDGTQETARLTGVRHLKPDEGIIFEPGAIGMHYANGLIDDCLLGGLDPDDLASDVIDFTRDLAATYRLHPAGTNIQRFDLPRLASFCSRVSIAGATSLIGFLHYRAVDMTTVRALLATQGHHLDQDHTARHRVDDCLDRDIAFWRHAQTLITPASHTDQADTDSEAQA
ncbi:hypothetical protein [Bifidobacterium parmae]|uniref:Uncharacterized protein n=1 Tax=Bifidobacterium parmae TaxID=361854 RepID=A0A2N5IVL8_9BIFI|nr:hypothetical protein [Bifidobacterium parmae]PLS26012.1 hypothetical protein Uis4E_2187 [Bifidobacterium parmae]